MASITKPRYIGWNWGVPASWNQVAPIIQPLINPSHQDYGSFNVIVVTKGVNIESSYDSWASGFYARKLFVAAKSGVYSFICTDGNHLKSIQKVVKQ
ncbi:hypothetical protein [Sporocytophaga myxococcoides]|uniref:hypothetical protein n=1 Tax=Sporocytophaga myxococcoides TaxID=153721 RepID=UPI00040A7A4F|nr:hypothetical protein [Sporocytophaga myxococcoides]